MLGNRGYTRVYACGQCERETEIGVVVEARGDGGRNEVGNQVGFEAKPRICCFGVAVEEVVES